VAFGTDGIQHRHDVTGFGNPYPVRQHKLDRRATERCAFRPSGKISSLEEEQAVAVEFKCYFSRTKSTGGMACGGIANANEDG
jgi:hypothetical protein